MTSQEEEITIDAIISLMEAHLARHGHEMPFVCPGNESFLYQHYQRALSEVCRRSPWLNAEFSFDGRGHPIIRFVPSRV